MALHRSVAELVDFIIQPMPAVIPIDTLTDTVGVPVDDTIWSAAKRHSVWISITGRLRQTGQREHEWQEHWNNFRNHRQLKV